MNEGDGGVFPLPRDPGIGPAGVVDCCQDQALGVDPLPARICNAIRPWCSPLSLSELADYLIRGDWGLEDITLVSYCGLTRVLWMPIGE